MARHVVETRRDRMALAHDAGFGAISIGSVLAGVLVAYGAFAVLAAIAGGVLTAMGVDSSTDLSADWRDVGIGTGIVAAMVLLVSYLWGGYVAGRMSRRAGTLNGFLVFVLGLLVAAGIGAAVGLQAETGAITDELRSIGVPTSWSEWSAIGTIAGAGALFAMLVGSLLGGMLGERWHGRLVTRALDPSIGATDVDLRDRDRRVDTADTTDMPGMTRADGRRTDGEHFDTSTTLDEDLAASQRR